MCDALERRGYEARPYAGGQDFQVPKVWPASGLKDFLVDAEDILIYHYSIGWEPGLELLRELKCRTVIKYHNVTPPEFFEGISQWHIDKCRDGRSQLREIVRHGCDLYLADSEYNRRELLDEGAEKGRSFVVPPFHHIDRLQDIAADLQMLDRFRDGKTNVLMVGRVAPHKGHPELIEAFAAYHHDYNRDSRLIIVGKEEEAFLTYSTRLREMIAFFLLEKSVEFIGEVSDAALKACYLLSNAFMFTSKHEGFCVPLVEAMAMKVPIVAYASSAIPDTVGNAGLVLEQRDPRLMAGAVNTLIEDETIAVALGLNGWRRFKRRYTNRKIEKEFLRALAVLG
jgi:glycosyltransferase involved in cell wall biosynthesis